METLQAVLYWCWPWLRPIPAPPYEPQSVRMEATSDGREVMLVRRAAIDPEVIA